MADQSGNVIAHRFTAQWRVFPMAGTKPLTSLIESVPPRMTPFETARFRLEIDGDHLRALDQFGQIAPEVVWVDPP